MIARCDWCDRWNQHATGYRYDPKRGSAAAHRCPTCRRPLRAKRRGDTEANIITALPPNDRLFP
jgi:hypothetical protein